MDQQNLRLADNKIKTRRLVGRPKRKWEDDINEFIKPREKRRKKYDLTNNNSWMTEAKKKRMVRKGRRI